MKIGSIVDRLGFAPGLGSLISVGRLTSVASRKIYNFTQANSHKCLLKKGKISQEHFNFLQERLKASEKSFKREIKLATLEFFPFVKIIQRVFAHFHTSARDSQNSMSPNTIIDHQKIATEQLRTMPSQEMDKNWCLGDYVGQIRVINLAARTDKLDGIAQDLEGIGLPKDRWQRFNAVLGKTLDKAIWNRMKSDHTIGKYRFTSKYREKADKLHQSQTGCFMSHYRAIKEVSDEYKKAKKQLQQALQDLSKKREQNVDDLAKELAAVAEAENLVKSLSSVLILEDDNRFGRMDKKNKLGFTRENTGRIFRQAMQDLPNNFDMIFLMSGNPVLGTRQISDANKPGSKRWRRVVRIPIGYDANAYIVHSRFYDILLKHLEKIETKRTPLRPYDLELSKIMFKNKVYTTCPPLAMQGEFKSDIDNKKPELRQRHNWKWKIFK